MDTNSGLEYDSAAYFAGHQAQTNLELRGILLERESCHK